MPDVEIADIQFIAIAKQLIETLEHRDIKLIDMAMSPVIRKKASGVVADFLEDAFPRSAQGSAKSTAIEVCELLAASAEIEATDLQADVEEVDRKNIEWTARRLWEKFKGSH